MALVVDAINERIRECRRDISHQRSEVQRAKGTLEGLKSALSIVASDTAGIIDDLGNAVTDIEDQIRKARFHFTAARAELERLEGELEGLKSVWETIREAIGSSVEESSDSSDLDDYAARGREISAPWRKILSYFLRQLPGALSVGDVMAFINQHDLKISRNAVRSQLHLYANRGFLKRVSDGVYKATDAVRKVC